MVQTFCVTSSYLELKGAVSRLSSENFQRKTHQKDPKHERDGTSLNINKRRSCWGRTVITEETIKFSILCVEDNAKNVSYGGNGLGLSGGYYF